MIAEIAATKPVLHMAKGAIGWSAYGIFDPLARRARENELDGEGLSPRGPRASPRRIEIIAEVTEEYVTLKKKLRWKPESKCRDLEFPIDRRDEELSTSSHYEAFRHEDPSTGPAESLNQILVRVSTRGKLRIESGRKRYGQGEVSSTTSLSAAGRHLVIEDWERQKRRSTTSTAILWTGIGD